MANVLRMGIQDVSDRSFVVPWTKTIHAATSTNNVMMTVTVPHPTHVKTMDGLVLALKCFVDVHLNTITSIILLTPSASVIQCSQSPEISTFSLENEAHLSAPASLCLFRTYCTAIMSTDKNIGLEYFIV